MTKKGRKAFDNKKYLREEKKLILERAKKFEQLYLEIGGHLLYDAHAKRVLPGYNPKNKMKLIKSLGNKVGLVYCINAEELEKDRFWGNTKTKLVDLAISEIEKLKKELNIVAISINLFNGQKKALDFIERIKKISKQSKIEILVTTKIKGYPKLASAFSKNGFEDQPFLETNKKLIAVTGAGANNGKMFFCLNQIYHSDKNKINAGYAKIETFPVWNLPLEHEVNLAYEAATADIKDKIMIDPFHLKKYKIKAVNYNRDVKAFPILKKIIKKATKKSNYMNKYFSPTNMGLNAVGKAIINDKKCREAGKKEILRRLKLFKKQKNEKAVKRIKKIISKV